MACVTRKIWNPIKARTVCRVGEKTPATIVTPEFPPSFPCSALLSFSGSHMIRDCSLRLYDPEIFDLRNRYFILFASRAGLTRSNLTRALHELIYYPFTADNHVKCDTSDTANIIANRSKRIASSCCRRAMLWAANRCDKHAQRSITQSAEVYPIDSSWKRRRPSFQV